MDLITPDLGLVVWTSLAFLILMFALTKFAWKPILSALKERETSIEEALKSAERAKKEMEELSSNNEKLILEAKQERDAVLLEARKIADTIISEAKESANEEGQKLIEKAKMAIENEKASAIASLRKEAVSLSIDIAEKVIRKELDNKDSQVTYAKGLVESADLSNF